MPGYKCLYLFCSNRDDEGKSFFRCPKNQHRAAMWLEASGREDLLEKNYKNYKLCEDHFPKKFMYMTVSGKRLYNDAVPSIFHGAKRRFNEVASEEPSSKIVILSADTTSRHKSEPKNVLTTSLSRNLTDNTDESYQTPSHLTNNDLMKQGLERKIAELGGSHLPDDLQFLEEHYKEESITEKVDEFQIEQASNSSQRSQGPDSSYQFDFRSWAIGVSEKLCSIDYERALDLQNRLQAVIEQENQEYLIKRDTQIEAFFIKMEDSLHEEVQIKSEIIND